MRALLPFFIKNEIRNKRAIGMILLGLVPPLIAFVLFIFQYKLQQMDIELSTIYPRVSLLIYLHFLLPLVSVLAGTSIITDEVRDRTLSYLMVRPNPKWSIVISKMLASIIFLVPIFMLSLCLTYSLLSIPEGISHWMSNIPQLLQSCMVLILGLVVYIPLFTFIGGLIKKPVILGLFFAFGWEAQVSLFPGNIKLLTVSHYLHVLYPTSSQTNTVSPSSILNFIIKTKQTSDLTAWSVLIVSCAVFTLLAASLLYIREYRMTQS